MTKSYAITIDTEPDCDIHWNRSAPLSFDSVLYGIKNTLRPLWNRYSIRPVYFVSPEVANNTKCCEILRNEFALGAEIGTHLHSEYIAPDIKHSNASGTRSSQFPCFACSSDVEFAKINNLTELIESGIGSRPISYRAARYGADIDTIKSLQKLGYKVDSSITPHIDWSSNGGPDHSTAPEQPYFISESNYYSESQTGLLEIPITISGKRLPFLPDRWLFYKWLRPSHMSAFEMKSLVRKFSQKHQNPVLNMMFHSMEIIPKKTPFVRTTLDLKLYLNRLESTIKYMLKNGFSNKTLKDIYDEKL